MACIYTLKTEAGELKFDTKEALMAHIRANQLYEELDSSKRNYEFTTKDLADSLRQYKFGDVSFRPETFNVFQEALLDEFIRLEDQSQYFYKMGAPIALTKGLGKSLDSIDGVRKNLEDLGIEAEWNKDIPFDVRYLLTGDEDYKVDNVKPYFHNITANNIGIMKEIDALSKTMFMERTPSFRFVADRVVANLKPAMSGLADKLADLRDELSSFSQIAAYKQWIAVNDKKTSTLRNSLIYDTTGNIPTIVDIVKDAQDIAPGNTFLQFILPVSTVVKSAKRKQRNILNRDLINTIEGRTRGRLEPDLIATLMDSFTELFQNPKTQYHAKALVDYLIVKDGLMFKNKSFIRMLPTLAFKDISDATGIATQLMAAGTEGEFKSILRKLGAQEIVDKEGNFVEYFTKEEKQFYNNAFKVKDLMSVKNALYKKVFGLDYANLYHRFEQIYATDVRNQYNLQLVRVRVRGRNNKTKVTDTITINKDEGTMKVTLFTDKFQKAEKGSDLRKELFKDALHELGEAGFPEALESQDKKTYINFKKYVRRRLPEDAGYVLYALDSVERDGKTYFGAEMTVTSEYIPRGTSATYKLVEPNGTSNSVGVADLGPRPTKDEITKIIKSKIKGDIAPEAPTPGTSGGVLGSEDSGTTFTRPNNEPIQDADALSLLLNNPDEIDPTNRPGGIFGGLTQLPYDPSTDMPLDFFSDEDVNDENC